MRFGRMVVLLYLGVAFINAGLAVELVEYNISVPDYLEVEKNLTISNILSYTDVTDAYDGAPWGLDWGDIHTQYIWNVTTRNGNVTIGFERYETASTQPLSMTFFRTVTEYLGSHIETRYREATGKGLANVSDNGAVNNSQGNSSANPKQKASGFEIALLVAAILTSCIFHRKRI